MLALHELQKQFASALKNEGDDILNFIQPSDKLTAKEHFAVYQSSVVGALQKCLKDIFPVCHQLVGEDFFMVMVNDYINKTPSYSPDLGDYGENFIRHSPLIDSVPYLADVSQLEWAWHRIFSAPENPLMDFQNLAECSQEKGEQIIFLLPLESFLLKSIYPIHRIWEVNQKDYHEDQTVVLEPDTSYYFLIWRSRLKMRIDLLNHLEWQLLSWMREGFTLGKICEKSSDMFPNTSIIEILPHLVQMGWLVDFTLGECSDVS